MESLVSEILALQLLFAAIVGLLAFGGVWWSSSWVIEDNIRKWGEQWISNLDELGMPLYVSQDDEKYVRERAEMRHDQKALISGAKQRIEDLENRMLEEKENIGKDKDLGWDATTLREEFKDQK